MPFLLHQGLQPLPAFCWASFRLEERGQVFSDLIRQER
uniref:Uncharacterized protein n=1 Tax=Anguilla anguilla TaxID=7936 RepID=A0A0E9RE12_ANGAN